MCKFQNLPKQQRTYYTEKKTEEQAGAALYQAQYYSLS